MINRKLEKRIKYYRHFKGGKYKILALGKDSDSLEDVVIYQALYGEGLVWVRPAKQFFRMVNVNGVEIPRFQEITETEAYEEK